MNIISIITICSFCLCIYLIYIILKIECKTDAHFILLAGSIVFGLWNFSAFFIYHSSTKEQILIAFKTACIFGFLFFPLINTFIFSISTKKGFRWWYLVVSFLPIALFVYGDRNGAVTFQDFVQTETGWQFIQPKGTVWNTLWLCYGFLVSSLSTAYLVLWSRRATLKREKKQIRLLLISSIVSWLLAIFEGVFHERIPWMRDTLLTSILFIPLISGYVIAMHRFQFLRLTPEHIAVDILRSINELVVLVNSERSVVYMNHTALRFFNRKPRKLQDDKLESLIIGPDGQCPILLPGDPEDDRDSPLERKRVLVRIDGHDESTKTLDLEISYIKDKWDDSFGFLFVGNEVLMPDEIFRRYDVTPRERDILQCIVNGWSYNMIMEGLNISENTVKTHMYHIYQKTGASNRMGLMKLFKE